MTAPNIDHKGLLALKASLRFDPYEGHDFILSGPGIPPETLAAITAREPVKVAFLQPGLLVGAVGLCFASAPSIYVWATSSHRDDQRNVQPIEGANHPKGFPRTLLHLRLVDLADGQTKAARDLVLPSSFAWFVNQRVLQMTWANYKPEWDRFQRAIIARHTSNGGGLSLALSKGEAHDDLQDEHGPALIPPSDPRSAAKQALLKSLMSVCAESDPESDDTAAAAAP